MIKLKKFAMAHAFLMAFACFGLKCDARASVPVSLKHALQGKIVGDRYISAGGAFNIALPSTSDASSIEDSYANPTTGGVAFFNDSGFLLKIEIDELLPEVTALITKHPDIKGEMLDAIFNGALLLQIKANVPKTTVMYQKAIDLSAGQPAHFAVLDLPEAATLIDLTTGRSLDSKRGYLVFFGNDRELITMSLQDTLSFIPRIANVAKETINERLLNHLLHYQKNLMLAKGDRGVD